MKLHETAMIVKLNMRQWSGRKDDKSATSCVVNHFHCKSGTGKYRKVLVAVEELKKVSKVVNESRSFHYENTLPWKDMGQRILPSANFLTHAQKMRELEDKFNKTVNEFCSVYADLVEESRATLNGLFNEKDYPHAEDIKGKYGFSVSVEPIPMGKDFRVDLGDDEVKRIRAEIEHDVKEATQVAMNDLWERLYQAVSHMAERLDGTAKYRGIKSKRAKTKDKRFRDSLVENLVDLVALIPKLNLTDDPKLEDIRRRIEKELTKFDPEDLREDKALRSKAKRSAEDILNAMGGYISK